MNNIYLHYDVNLIIKESSDACETYDKKRDC